MKMIHMVGLNGIVSILRVGDIAMMIGRLKDGKTSAVLMVDGEREYIGG